MWWNRKTSHPYLFILSSIFFVILLVVILNHFNIFYINIPEDDKQAEIYMLKFSAIVSIIGMSVWYFSLRFALRKEIRNNKKK